MRHSSKQTTDNTEVAKQPKETGDKCDRICTVCHAQAQLLRKIVDATVKELRRGTAS